MTTPLERFCAEAADLYKVHGADGVPFASALDAELAISRQLFFDNPHIDRLRKDVIAFLYDEPKLGIRHAKHVAIDAAAMVIAQTAGEEDKTRARRCALAAQMAGLLLDVCHAERDHHARAAEMSRTILQDYGLDEELLDMMACAVANHDGHARCAVDNPDFALVSDAVYDADTLRWGFDFAATCLWEMSDYETDPPERVQADFAAGVDRLDALAKGFRSPLGRRFGPDALVAAKRVAPHVVELLARHFASAGTSDE